MNNAAIITELHCYPVKSCSGLSINSAYLGARGLKIADVTDRCWMIVNKENVLVSQREAPELARVKVGLVSATGKEARASVVAEGMPLMVLDPLAVQREAMEVSIHGKKNEGSFCSVRS